MGLSHEHVGPKILEKIKIYVLTRAKLLFNLCYEIPCIIESLGHLHSYWYTIVHWKYPPLASFSTNQSTGLIVQGGLLID